VYIVSVDNICDKCKNGQSHIMWSTSGDGSGSTNDREDIESCREERQVLEGLNIHQNENTMK